MSGFKVLRSTDDWEGLYGPAKLASVVSIGNFDGLHLGHQKILHSVVERARGSGGVLPLPDSWPLPEVGPPPSAVTSIGRLSSKSLMPTED